VKKKKEYMKKNVITIVCLVMTAVLVPACKKNSFFSQEAKRLQPAVADAKEWYYGTFIKTADFKKLDTTSAFVSFSKRSVKKYPVWKNSKSYKRGIYSFVEAPYMANIKVYVPFNGTMAKSESEHISIAKASVSRIVFITTNGLTNVRILTWVPTLEFARKKGFDLSDISFENYKKDFSGYMILRSWDERILSVNKIGNGKLIKKDIKLVKWFDNRSMQTLNSSAACEYEIPLLEQECTLWESDYAFEALDPDERRCFEWRTTVFGSIQMIGDCPPEGNNDEDNNDIINDPYFDCVQNSSDNCTCLYFGLYCDGNYPPGDNFQYDGYSFSAEDLYRINYVKNEVDAVDQAYNQANNNFCYGTGRLGSVFFQGNVQHWLIQYDYISRYPGGVREYSIPYASFGNPANRGYADLANLLTKEIFEIKPDNDAGRLSGLSEANHYVAMANTQCFNGVWVLGSNYAGTILPNPWNPTSNLQTRLYQNGVIVYKELPRSTNPVTVPLPQNIIDKLKNLAQRLKNNLNNAEYEIQRFLKQHPELVTFIKNAAITAGVAIIIGTIVEDILTAGVGIADDWACFLAGYKLIRFATLMP
jgi:hypothetical protein